MNDAENTISKSLAEQEVSKAVRRLALLHLAFSETLVKQLGEKEGKRLIIRAISNYGMKIGHKARKDAQDRKLPLTPESFSAVPGESFPSIAGHDRVEFCEKGGKETVRAYGCLLAKVWKEYGGEELGRLYCLIDPAMFMAFNPEMTLIHTKALPDGDDYCELEFRKTTHQERKDFAEGSDWSYMDIKDK